MKNVRTMGIFILAVILSPANSSGGQNVTAENSRDLAPPVMDPETYDVYAALLKGRFGPGERLLLISTTETMQDSTGTDDNHCIPKESEKDSLRAGFWDAIQDYRKKNAAPTRIKMFAGLNTAHRLVDDYHGHLFARSSRHPDATGLIALSAVGFNESKTRAIVYMGYSCGVLCGDGGYYYLEKDIEGEWVYAEPGNSRSARQICWAT